MGSRAVGRAGGSANERDGANAHPLCHVGIICTTVLASSSASVFLPSFP